MGEHDPNILRRARDLYAVYCASSDGKNYQVLPCPAWDALTPAVRGHWYVVALRATELGDAIRVIASDGTVSEAPPSERVLGHLTDPNHAADVWRCYAGLDGQVP